MLAAAGPEAAPQSKLALEHSLRGHQGCHCGPFGNMSNHSERMYPRICAQILLRVDHASVPDNGVTGGFRSNRVAPVPYDVPGHQDYFLRGNPPPHLLHFQAESTTDCSASAGEKKLRPGEGAAVTGCSNLQATPHKGF